ncbi:hypothetical protein [Prevotella jejuni]|uniref:hypothetical protein n=1 Tax=Prevotella jejuni TaxID=1177574 RepID=UPI0028ECB756|nr:hypothetical protein [Prevotella jejuni]
MENNLHNANEELASLLGQQPTNKSQSNTIFPKQNNTVIDQEVVISNSTINTENKALSPKKQYELFQKIDNICFNIYREISTIDESFGKISKMFYDLAENYGNRALNTENEEQFAIETATATTLAIASFATEGAGRLVNAIKTQITIQNKIIPLLKREAQEKKDFVNTLYSQLDSICKGNLEVFYKHISVNYQKDSKELRNQQLFTNLVEKPITTSLNILRDSLYHYKLLAFLKEQFELWTAGKIGEGVMPDYGIVNHDIIYRYIFDAPEENINKEIQLSLYKTLGIEEAFNTKDQYIPGTIYPIILDEQLLALYMSGLGNCGDNVFEKASELDYSSCLKYAFLSNPSYKDYALLSDEYSTIEAKQGFRMLALVLNTILATIICGICSFRYFENWWWPTIVTICVLLIAAKKSYSTVENFNLAYEMKLHALKLYTLNTLQSKAGFKFNKLTLSKLNESSIKTFAYAIIGGIIGLIILSVLGLIIGILLGAMLSKTEIEKYQSDGSDYSEIKTGSGWLAYTFTIILIAGLIYII